MFTEPKSQKQELTQMEDSQNWKHRLKHEISGYILNVVYLGLFFGVIITYQRLILASYDIDYTNYGFALIQALILGKVIMIGDILKLGNRIEKYPLIYSTLYKTIVFVLWVILFKILEESIKGLIHGEGMTSGIHKLFSENQHMLVAHTMIVFSAFLPFFGIRELSRALGPDKIHKIFFNSTK